MPCYLSEGSRIGPRPKAKIMIITLSSTVIVSHSVVCFLVLFVGRLFNGVLLALMIDSSKSTSMLSTRRHFLSN